MTTEASPDQQREVLEALFAKRFPDHYMPGRSGIGPSRWAKFTAMLDAGAFVDAALLLVPEGWLIGRLWQRNTRSGNKPWFAELWQPTTDREVKAGADTPALAICAAIESLER